MRTTSENGVFSRFALAECGGQMERKQRHEAEVWSRGMKQTDVRINYGWPITSNEADREVRSSWPQPRSGAVVMWPEQHLLDPDWHTIVLPAWFQSQLYYSITHSHLPNQSGFIFQTFIAYLILPVTLTKNTLGKRLCLVTQNFGPTTAANL